MVTKKGRKKTAVRAAGAGAASSSVEELLLAALERGDDSFETGRYLVTFKEGATEEGVHRAARGYVIPYLWEGLGRA